MIKSNKHAREVTDLLLKKLKQEIRYFKFNWLCPRMLDFDYNEDVFTDLKESTTSILNYAQALKNIIEDYELLMKEQTNDT